MACVVRSCNQTMVAARVPRATGRQTARRDIPLIEEDAGTQQHAHETDEQEVPDLLCASANARQQGKVAVVQGRMGAMGRRSVGGADTEFG